MAGWLAGWMSGIRNYNRMNGERWKKASEWGLWKMNGTSENENIVMERVLDRSSRFFLIEQCKILN